MPFKSLATDTLAVAVVTAPAVGTSEVWTVTTTPSDTPGRSNGLGATVGTTGYDFIVDDGSGEICHVTAVNVGAKQLTLTRGFAGSTPATHLVLASLVHLVTAESLNTIAGGLHAASHAAGGTDVVTLTEAQITALATDLASRAALGGRTTFSNAAYPAVATDKYIAQIGTLSAPRTVTLPTAASVGAGYMLYVADESGSITATNTITLAPHAGGDTITGVTKLGEAYRLARCVSDGVSNWLCDKVFMPLVQDFTPAGSYTSVIPPNCTTVQMIGQGAGSGGASGDRAAAGLVRGGGGGGGSGGVSQAIYQVSDLGGTGTTLTITVAAGTVGALAQTVDSTAGINSTSAAATTVVSGGITRLSAGGGTAAVGGTTAGGNGGAGGANSTFTGVVGGAGGASGAGVAPANSGTATAGGGGGGGGISAANADFGGGVGGIGARAYSGGSNVGGTAGTNPGGAGGNATVVQPGNPGGGGGGGGGSNAAGVGGTGGNGIRGGGGGGGGSSLNGNNSGAGGVGGDGWVRIIYQ